MSKQQQFSQAEYIWIDGAQPTQKLRSKTRIIPATESPSLEIFPEWSFDGSSTYQASGHDSDCILKPVRFVTDPTRGPGNYLVMCEVYNSDSSTPHPSNKRAELRRLLDADGHKAEMWVGFEQEYTLFNGSRPLGFPEQGGYPAPQGPFYCGVGGDEVYGRKLVEIHTKACLDAGIMIYGINAEVMPGQWEFQIGYRGLSTEPSDPLYVSDHLWLARWLLYRLGEDVGISATLHPKPVRGDWNGAGGHTNFSTKEMRDPATGKSTIEKAIKALADKHMEHIDVYGADNAMRLTGLHETCHISQFKHGVADRGCSIRIPRSVANKGYGYLEDRRPAANLCPYTVSARLLKTICGLS